MEQFEGIFKSKIQQEDSSSKTPVAHAIKDFLECSFLFSKLIRICWVQWRQKELPPKRRIE